MTRSVRFAALGALLLAAPAALANDFVSDRPADTFTFVDPGTGRTITSKIRTVAPGDWLMFSDFAGLGGTWLHVSPTSDALGLWVPSAPAAQRYQALPSLSGPVGAQTTIDLGGPNVGTVTVGEVGGLVRTAAGIFRDVTRLDFSSTAPHALMSLWFARDVGVVQWYVDDAAGWTTMFTLQSAIVNGVALPTPGGPPIPPPPPPAIPGSSAPPLTPPVIYGQPLPPDFRPFQDRVVSLPWQRAVGRAVDTGDLNGDGLVDIAVAWDAYGPAFSVLHQSPGGAHDAPVIHGLPGTVCHSLVVADVTGDGRDDVVVGTMDLLQVFVQTPAGALVARAPVQCPAFLVRTGDVNGDGLEDVVAIGWTADASAFPSGEGVHVLLQDVQGGLGVPTVYPVDFDGPSDLDVGDVTGDGKDDVVVLSGQRGRAFAVMRQDHLGRLAGPAYFDLPVPLTGPVGQTARGLAIGDVTGDGWNDVVVSSGSSAQDGMLTVFGQGFSPSDVTFYRAQAVGAVEVADVDQDGRADVVAHGLAPGSAVSIWLQDAAGLLDHAGHPGHLGGATHGPQALELADVNGDGKLDLVLAHQHLGLVISYQD